jgi:hypothetical protein
METPEINTGLLPQEVRVIKEEKPKRTMPSIPFGIILIIAAIIGSALYLKSSINSNTDTNSNVLLGAISNVDVNVQAGNADIITGLDGIQAGIGEIKDSVAKIPTKPVVVTKAPTISKQQKYNNCVKWVNGSGLDAANAKMYLNACLNWLK